MSLFRYYKGHLGVVFLTFLLLVCCVFCDLKLPDYTSDIVDVGIQQSGVEDVAPAALTQDTHDLVAMLLSEEDESLFLASYDETSDGIYELNDAGLAARDTLDDLLVLPLVLINYAAESDTADIQELYQAYSAGLIDKSVIGAFVEQARAAFEEAGLGESLLAQQALSVAKDEYTRAGYDISDIQMSYLIKIGLSMLGIALLSMLLNIAISFLSSRCGTQIARDLRERIYLKVISFSEKEIDSFSTASLITRCTNDIQLIQMVEVMVLRMVLYAPIMACGGIFMVMQTNVSMTWVIALCVATLFVFIAVLLVIAMPKFKIMQKLVDRVNLISREILTGLPVIRAFCREEHEKERFRVANEELMRTQLFTNRTMAFLSPMVTLIMNMTGVLIVWIGGHYIDTGTLQTGDLIAFITYSMMVIASFLVLAMVSIMLPRALVAAGRIDEILACEVSIADAASAAACDEKLLDTAGCTIEFDDVSFAYAEGSDPALDHVSFEVRPGQTLAIIGATGSGKSTILKLLERFYDVGSGAIRIDGVDIRDLSQKKLRLTLGYVPQKAFLFSGTIDSNVGFSADDISSERKQMALDVAQARDFVDERPDGVASEIAQGGLNVSGGQRQRLAIARALASDARAFLFDDSFSALDYKTDAALRADLRSKLQGKTVIIVAQRVATIMQADTIVVLDQGRVAGMGTHEELLQTCQTYREIVESQFSQEELDKEVS